MTEDQLRAKLLLLGLKRTLTDHGDELFTPSCWRWGVSFLGAVPEYVVRVYREPESRCRSYLPEKCWEAAVELLEEKSDN